jgi:hypothetical protein
VSAPTDDLARLWVRTADTQLRGYSPLYDRIARSVADDRATLALVQSAPPTSHLPLLLLCAVHYLVLDGLEHPLSEVYAGRSDADPAPLFLEVCRTHWDEVAELLASRHVQTNECGRSALFGPGLSWLASRWDAPPALIDVGASAGLSLLCHRYRLDYGDHGATGPEGSTVEVRCQVVAGHPPIAAQLPTLASRVGIDRSPLDVTRPEDARWLLACVWPDTGRLDRTAASIRLAQEDPPTLIQGDANAVLPGVLEGLPDGTPAIVLTTWSFAYFSRQQRREFVDLLERASHTRPVAWLTADGPGIVEAFAQEEVPDPDGTDTCLLGAVMFDRGHQESRLLALIQPHGRWLDWRAGPP